MEEVSSRFCELCFVILTDKNETGRTLYGDDRDMTERYLTFFEEIIFTLPTVEIVGKLDRVLAVLENENSYREHKGVFTADNIWLPGTYERRSVLELFPRFKE